MADYLTSGFDLVDVSEAPETPLETASHAYVLVVETAEFENPADGAVTLLRDLLAANKKTKTTLDGGRCVRSRTRLRRRHEKRRLMSRTRRNL